MTTDSTDPDGFPQGWVTADGVNAVRLLKAMLADDAAEVELILQEFPSSPPPLLSLLAGVSGMALAALEIAANDNSDRLRRMLDVLALSPKLNRANASGAFGVGVLR